MSKTRLDVAFPDEIYNRIKEIAIAEGQPKNRKTGQVTLTPVVLNLVRLGLEKYEEEGFVELEKKNQPLTVGELANILFTYLA